MKTVRTQDMHICIPIERIVRTTVEKKDDTHWIVTATVENDRPVVLARYPSEEIALLADVKMWFSDADSFVYPTSDMVVEP